MERAARGTMALPLETSDRLVEILWAWRNGTTPSGPAHVLAVIPLARIAESDWVLSPERYLEPVPVETVPRPRAPHRLLSRLSVSGFKSFGPPQEAHLRPITLIYGANSAGKSSFIQSLLLMKQSIGAASLVTQGAVTDAGSFTGALHRHDPESGMAFRLMFGSNESWSLDPLGAPDPSLEREVALSFGADLSGLPKQAAVMFASDEWIMTFASEPPAADGVGLLGLSLDELADGMDAIATGAALYPFAARRGGEVGADEEKRLKARRSNATRVLRALSRAGVERVVVERDGLLPSARWRRTHLEAIGNERLASAAESYVKRALQLAVGTAHEFRQLLDGLTYLGPLRSAPQRFYNRAALASGSSTSGEHVALYLFDNISEVDLVNEWLVRLGVPYAVKVAPLAAAGSTHIVGDLVAMILTDLRSGVEVSPADVGFGVSQLLPIVVELLARSNSVLCIEQPEIHLHPALQTELGDLLIEATSATGRANQVLVETHSEHLVLRLQRRIREGTLDPEDVAVLYVDQDAEGEARISRLALGGDGSFLDEWPHGFFEERLDELFGGGE